LAGLVADVDVGGVRRDAGELGVIELAGADAPTTSATDPAPIRDTLDFSIPDIAPSASTRWSRARIDSPLT
jgi:hypothetical protein